MISEDFLQILRCPLDPKRQTALSIEGDRLVCPRCQLRYKIKDGFPVLIVEEAELPPGCASLDEAAGRHE